jgi:DNA-binding HxlR family transcriptional regulator
MPTSRSYHDRCPIARALDVVGERWGLLVVRELLLGPQRFSDLRRALPGASSNMLTDRLRELAAHGVVSRRRLPPPAASVVYELTQRGRALEPVLEALGQWGSGEPSPQPGSLSPSAVLLFLRGSALARPLAHTYRVKLDETVWTISSHDDVLQVTPGDPEAPAASLETDPDTLNALLLDPSGLDGAVASGAARVAGSRAALRRLLRVAV